MSHATPRAFTGRHMLLIMVGFFATIFAANMTLVYFASHSWSGLVVKNSYVASQNFNELTSRLEASRALNLDVTARYAAGQVVIHVQNSTGEAPALTNVVLNLGDAKTDQDSDTPLSHQADGSWTAAKDLTVGKWSGLVSARVDGKTEWVQAFSLQVEP